MLRIKVNGKLHEIETSPDTPLLYVLRNELSLNSPKFGCGLGQCGACTVLLDQEAVRSCVIPVSAATKRAVTTLEGLGSEKNPHPLQKAFIEEQAMQCGYCVSGMIMQSAALLHKTSQPTTKDIRSALDGNLCRCGAHMRILRAVQRATRSATSLLSKTIKKPV